jgi:threonine aldolase
LDELCILTLKEFRRVFGPTVEPHYVFTGTAANVLCMSPFLRSFEAVICADDAHLNVDECGAPEKFWGAKLWPLPTSAGKISPSQCKDVLSRGGDQHFSQPRAVSLTQPTELGTCYSLEELREWRRFTSEKNLMLHLDGARLVNAAVHLDVSLKELTADIGVDAVSFGGTKNGLMGAEACLLFSDAAKANFKFYRKQAMQLSSKTRFLAAQFYAFLKDDLWREIARGSTMQAQDLCRRLREFEEIRLAQPVESNALFVHLPKEWIAPLRKKYFFYIWPGAENLCRWMISFDWTAAMTENLISEIREVKKCFPVK